MTRTEALLLLSEQQNHRCCYCGHRMIRHQHYSGVPIPLNAMTRDHIEPRSYGGVWFGNIIIACALCNNLRGNMEAYAFYNLMQKWFRRNPDLHARWHHTPKELLRALKIQCLLTQERQLRGLARRYIEEAFRHRQFVTNHRNQQMLRAA